MEAEREVVIRLLELLKVLGVDQRTVASRLGVTKALVSQWKSGFRPVARHQLDAMSDLLGKAIDEDSQREDRAQVELKTPAAKRRWRFHKLARADAIKAYHESLQRWFEAIRPGSGLQQLYRDADEAVRRVSPYLAREAASWTVMDRVGLAVQLGMLLNTITLINRLAPMDTSWERLVQDGGEGDGEV
jgi:transcriptional regulator with XRE-family HTH domain